MIDVLVIPAAIVTDIQKQAGEEAPNEACGYLSGDEGVVRSRIPMVNVDASPEHFSFDPNEQFSALKQSRERSERLIAVYHSHPETPARMSREDIRLANDPVTAYVIHSVADNATRAYRVDREKHVTEIAVQIATGVW